MDNYNSAQAITKAEEDVFDWKNYYKHFARELIKLSEQEDSLVFGLCGPWASGKTSLLNLTKLEMLERWDSKNQAPIFINFEPWNFLNSEQIFFAFFNCIMTELKRDKLNKAARLIKKYADCFADLPGIWGVSAKALKKMSDVDIIEAKEKVKNELRKSKKKIFFIIDDIDRMNDEQICLIFQLVKSIAPFPNIIYILLYDKNIAVKALSTIQKDDGEAYLEKIVQIEINMPQIHTSCLRAILAERVEDIVSEEHEDAFDGKILSAIMRLIGNLRDVYRISNAFRFKYYLLSARINYIDLLALTALETIVPKITKWLYSNIGAISEDRGIQAINVLKRESGELEEYYDKEKLLSTIKHFYPDKDSQDIFELICRIFPRLFSDRIYNYDEFFAQRRVAHYEIMKTYLQFRSESLMPKNDVDPIFLNSDEKELVDIFSSTFDVNNRFGLYEFNAELSGRIRTLPDDRLVVIAIAIFRTRLIDTNNFGLLVHVVKGIKNEEARHELLNKMCAEINADNLEVMNKIIYEIEHDSERLDNPNDYSKCTLLSAEHLKQLEDRYFNFIKNNINDRNIAGDIRVLRLWRDIKPSDFKDYLLSIKSSDKLLLVILITAIYFDDFKHKSIFGSFDDFKKRADANNVVKLNFGNASALKEAWKFDITDMPIEHNELINIIEQIIKTKEFTDLSKTQQEQIACIYIAIKEKRSHILRDESEKLLENWMKGN